MFVLAAQRLDFLEQMMQTISGYAPLILSAPTFDWPTMGGF